MDTYLLIALVVLLVIFIGICYLGRNTYLMEGFTPSNSVMMYSRNGKNAKITDITSKITVTSGTTKTDYVSSGTPPNTYTSASSGTAVYDSKAKTITITNGTTTTVYTNTSGSGTTFTAPNNDTAVISGSSTITVNPGNVAYTSSEPALDPSNRYDTQTYTSNGYGTGVLTYVTGNPMFSVTDTNGTITVFSTNVQPGGDQNNNNNQDNNQDNNNDDSSYDNYNHYTGSSYPSIFYGPDGGTARIIQTGTDMIVVITNKNGTTEIYYISNGQVQKGATQQAFVGPNGNTATITTGSNGKKIIKVTTAKGTVIAYNPDNTYNYQSQDQDMNQYDSSTSTTGSDYNSAFTNANNSISKSMIPPGQEDMYILKSSVPELVCPSCPTPLLKCNEKTDSNTNSNNSNYSCGSNQQIPYEYKQVPDYSAMSANQMPMPVLNDFSTFGM